MLLCCPNATTGSGVRRSFVGDQTRQTDWGSLNHGTGRVSRRGELSSEYFDCSRIRLCASSKYSCGGYESLAELASRQGLGQSHRPRPRRPVSKPTIIVIVEAVAMELSTLLYLYQPPSKYHHLWIRSRGPGSCRVVSCRVDRRDAVTEEEVVESTRRASKPLAGMFCCCAEVATAYKSVVLVPLF